MEQYEELKLDIIVFDTEDVITASGGGTPIVLPEDPRPHL